MTNSQRIDGHSAAGIAAKVSLSAADICNVKMASPFRPRSSIAKSGRFAMRQPFCGFQPRLPTRMAARPARAHGLHRHLRRSCMTPAARISGTRTGPWKPRNQHHRVSGGLAAGCLTNPARVRTQPALGRVVTALQLVEHVPMRMLLSLLVFPAMLAGLAACNAPPPPNPAAENPAPPTNSATAPAKSDAAPAQRSVNE